MPHCKERSVYGRSVAADINRCGDNPSMKPPAEARPLSFTLVFVVVYWGWTRHDMWCGQTKGTQHEFVLDDALLSSDNGQG
jgi:hypothetical protein